MPTPLSLPYPPLVVIDAHGPLSWDSLSEQLAIRLEAGVSFCLREAQGHEKRGGYFFHIKSSDQGFTFRTFDRQIVCSFPTGAECAAFINHVAGRLYDEEMWQIAQKVNLRTDADT